MNANQNNPVTIPRDEYNLLMEKFTKNAVVIEALKNENAQLQGEVDQLTFVSTLSMQSATALSHRSELINAKLTSLESILRKAGVNIIVDVDGIKGIYIPQAGLFGA